MPVFVVVRRLRLALSPLPPPEPATPSAIARRPLRRSRHSLRSLRRRPLLPPPGPFYAQLASASPSADAGVYAPRSSVRLRAPGSSVLLSVPHFRLMIMVDLVVVLLSN
ncbi:hypothetical protein GUJ93_ZPchr0001g31363 [Zizania palustris]|uniref:Uncharacterized protein n=1 Tax=Zizania palustris TaxID=103762 RepID=A0A8J5RRE3_ZIZPA|nr:hypothetical protein GUJ93_ZPchr0001g31363 [Zizania palustris]